jgi:polar amino acid transport system substrate-binding protein
MVGGRGKPQRRGGRTAWTLAGGLCAAIVLTACGSSSSSTKAASNSSCHPVHHVHTISAGELKVAVYSYPPYGYQSGSQLAGVDGEIINRIAVMECLKVKPLPGAAAAMIPDVQTGRSDTAMGDWYRTEPRSKIVLLGAPVYKDQMVLVSKSGLSTVQQLKGKTVGSVLGFLWDDDLTKLLGGSMKLYPTDEAAYADMKAGRIQAVVDTPGAALFELKTEGMSGYKYVVVAPDQSVAATIHPGQANYPVKKDNTALYNAMAADIATLRANGTIAHILTSHGFPASSANPGPPQLLGA